MEGKGKSHQDAEAMAVDGDQELEIWWDEVNQLETELEQVEALSRGGYLEDNFKEPVWQLSVTNGYIQLDTTIRSMDEMLIYKQASIKYLSPFIGLFKHKVQIQFESTSISVPLGSNILMQRRAALRPRPKKYVFDSSNAESLPLFDYRAIIDTLIPLYLKSVAVVSGLLHAPTFLEYYQKLDDPLNDPIILAVCVDALVTIRLDQYSTKEKRVLAETFYNKCRDKLFDMYDDSAYKFKAVITTSFLLTYLMDMLLNYVEARRLVTVAVLICSDLEKKYNDMDPVERILYQRHRMNLEMAVRTFSLIFEDKMDYTVTDRKVEFDILDDEPEETREHIAIYNHIFRLIGHPYITTVLGRINNIFYGRPCDLFLEDVLRLETFLRDWWDTLPSDYRLCEDPFNPSVYKLVEKKLRAPHLLPLIAVHVATGLISASLLEPRLSTEAGCITSDILHSMRERLGKHAANSSRVLVYALKGNWTRTDGSDTPSFSCCMITQILYCLDKISSAADVQFPRELLGLFKKSFDTKIKPLLPLDHAIPSSSSPLVSYITENSKDAPLEMYDHYPFPGYALLSDMFSTSISLLEKRLVHDLT
ncbi:hypothetical protein BJV82DRAFT_667492 [Fennellomyces sp. T-0311]|nr:hypothetical protein BJV82DRAFT_667492 [Fennellomyces sp. T-0311]